MLLSATLALPLALPATTISANAASGDRTIYLYYTHTKETAKITFKRNGRYDHKALAQLNQFLRDWRRNEPTKMDPALFDLVWEVYQESGASGPIHVVSAYRAPATNEMLRSKSSAVAKNSRHTMGMAMDFFIPGVNISKLRQVAMRKQVGGVGYYPTSGSPFVHLDTGNVRAWPRMTRAQLKKVFPDGKTLHVPSDGVPLSKSGYQFAKAQWTKCHAVPCNGRSASTIRVAQSDSKSTDDNNEEKPTLLGWLFGSEDDEGSEEDTIAVAASPTERSVSSIPVTAPVPMARPNFMSDIVPTVITVAEAPVPAARPADLFSNSGDAPNPAPFPGSDTIAVAALNAAPRPRALITPVEEGQANPLLSAYAPVGTPEPDAQRTLQMLIERNTAPGTAVVVAANESAAPARYEIASGKLQTASVANGAGFDILGNLIESSWTSVTKNGVKRASPPLRMLNIATREVELVAPDFEHVIDIFVDGDAMSSDRYGVLFERDVADFNPSVELGSYANLSRLSDSSSWGLSTSRFVSRAPIVVASR